MDALLDFAPIALVVFIASAVQGFFGFGYGIIAMGTLTMTWDLVHASAFVNVSSLMMAGTVVVREYQRILWPILLRVLPAMGVGIAIGLIALRDLPRDWLVGALALMIIAIGGWNAASPSLRTRVSNPLDVAVGFVAGLTSGAFQVGGPPLVIHLYRRPESPLTLVVTLQAIFIGSGLLRAMMAGAQGLLVRDAVVDALLSLPFVVLGTLLGVRSASRVDPMRFRRAAWVALALLGLALLASVLR